MLIEVDDYATALACYRSPAYQLAKQQRRQVAEAMITILDGLPLTQ